MLSHHAGSLNVQGQIYLMSYSMTGLNTVTLSNDVEHFQYLETIFGETRMSDWTND